MVRGTLDWTSWGLISEAHLRKAWEQHDLQHAPAGSLVLRWVGSQVWMQRVGRRGSFGHVYWKHLNTVWQ